MLVACTASASLADGSLVSFPDDFKEGVLYFTRDRGALTEYLYTTRKAIEAAKADAPFPSGTVITLVEYYRDSGELKRYVVMEKRAGWGSEYPEDIRNGEWEYQAFNPDKTVQKDESLERCFSCHKSMADNDYVFTVDEMKDE
ncbi:cytochrome P460 family protein [Limisalsivibrio acetivorans]|uniref:cytochrome P460 family protein n=1 Tax=Limisalsivibrio acetivorans TaxID=1304888 RepID=UPI00138AC9F9|nr:cytochrome P460 family protein [Limisalsivibrio acetivorans]